MGRLTVWYWLVVKIVRADTGLTYRYRGVQSTALSERIILSNHTLPSFQAFVVTTPGKTDHVQ